MNEYQIEQLDELPEDIENLVHLGHVKDEADNGIVCNYKKFSIVMILINAGHVGDLAYAIYDKIFELWFGTDEEIGGKLNAITPPGLLNFPTQIFKPGTGMYQSITDGYSLSNKQKKALDKILGWHECVYGKAEILKENDVYLFKGQNGYNILSSKENGDLKDIIVSHDANIKLNGNSFELEKTGDEFNYIFSKVREE